MTAGARASRLRALPWPPTILLILTVLVPAIGAGALVYTQASESPLQAAASADPIIATVLSAERSYPQAVSVELVETGSVPVVSSAHGIVTSMELAVGAQVGNGTIVATVDDQAIVAYASPRPLWRDIARGDKGPDVSSAQAFLQDLGFYSGPVDGDAGFATERAIRAFNEHYGFGRGVRVLSRGSLAWIGPEAGVVSSVDAQPGDDAAGRITLVGLGATGTILSVEQTQAFATDGETILTIGATTVPYLADSGAISDLDDIAAIRNQLNEEGRGFGQIRLATPQRVATMPASAIVTDGSGGMCVFADPSSGPEAIQPLHASAGLVDIDPSWIGRQVLVNPREVREDLSCG